MRAALGCPVTEIGEIVRGSGVTVIAAGRALAPTTALGTSISRVTRSREPR